MTTSSHEYSVMAGSTDAKSQLSLLRGPITTILTLLSLHTVLLDLVLFAIFISISIRRLGNRFLLGRGSLGFLLAWRPIAVIATSITVFFGAICRAIRRCGSLALAAGAGAGCSTGFLGSSGWGGGGG